ncbi:hypothetical protein BEQ96_10010 [Campylobacter coli]|uniref:hypothetical protein n=8 Tax=Campylobacter coli TaxID=195 RepID=UPI00126E458E|nr:hypothetical protein [Campylobacter coli]EAJ2265600.1 hypothetical protein [Campylobacter coli]EAL2305227.1 hypothetical protein [Campylobacter coli]EAL3720181.1 hypothetical protein [Campylobacter coli]EHA2146678.1 hypothetical protein [Campylobacter coli]EHP7433573.1 hypothetical protein [Campylobacter coli]
MKNIVLLGGSNSVLTNGLKNGLQCEESIVLKNYALGACTCLQNLYALILNKNDILDADLLVTESNVNEIHSFCRIKMPLKQLSYIINTYYEELSFLNIKILVLILPICEKHPSNEDIEIINDLHRKNCVKYGFNCIDMQSYYKKNNVFEFFMDLPENHHPMETIMNKLGRNIAKNIDAFKYHLQNKNKLHRKYAFFIPEVDTIGNKLETKIKSNSLYRETIVRITDKAKILFPSKFQGYRVAAIYTWNDFEEECYGTKVFSSLVLENLQTKIVKPSNGWMQFSELHQDFNIDCSTFAYFNSQNTQITENSILIHGRELMLKHVDLIAFFLIKDEYNNLSINMDFNFAHEKTNKLFFDKFIPDLCFLKNVIQEYCSKKQFESTIAELKSLLSQKELQLQNKTNELKNLQEDIIHKKQLLEVQNLEQDLNLKSLQTKEIQENINLKILEKTKIQKELDQYNNVVYIERYHQSAKQRIYNHLSYKLGFCAIKKSKTLWGWISMPIILLSIFISHKQEQKIYQEKIKKDPSLKLPSLELYTDYQEARKEENSFTYKLGQAIMNANKTWYKGGYVKLWFEIRKLKEKENIF